MEDLQVPGVQQEEQLKLKQHTVFLLLEALMVHLSKLRALTEDQLQVVPEEDLPGQEILQEEHLNQPTEALECQLQHPKLNQTTGFLHLEALMAILRVLMEHCL
jgi:cell division protein ZapA (FtsZ GTPase activity inhibitor)